MSSRPKIILRRRSAEMWTLYKVCATRMVTQHRFRLYDGKKHPCWSIRGLYFTTKVTNLLTVFQDAKLEHGIEIIFRINLLFSVLGQNAMVFIKQTANHIPDDSRFGLGPPQITLAFTWRKNTKTPFTTAHSRGLNWTYPEQVWRINTVLVCCLIVTTPKELEQL
jgi:hypothetical protein